MYVNEWTELLVVVDRTATESLITKELERKDIREMLSPVTPAAVEAFIERGARPKTLEESFDLKAKYVLLSHDKRDEYFKPGVMEGWRALEEKYPGPRASSAWRAWGSTRGGRGPDVCGARVWEPLRDGNLCLTEEGREGVEGRKDRHVVGRMSGRAARRRQAPDRRHGGCDMPSAVRAGG